MQQRLVTLVGCLSVMLGGSNTVLGFVWGARGASPLTRSPPSSTSSPTSLHAQALLRPTESTTSSDMGTRLLADLKVAAQAGDSNKAFEILNSLDGQSLPKTIVHFNRVLKACVEGKEMGKIEGVLEQMNGSGAMMDEVTVKLLVNAYVSQGKLAEAVDVFEQAREEEVIGAVDPSLYDTVIGAYRQQGAFEKAMDLCDEMRFLRLNPTKEGYAFIATVAVKDGKTYLINRTLETMKQEGFAVSEIEYVKGIIEKELPENLKHQQTATVARA
ncbi:pentatricopeptide repeat containining protein [Nannochloropsis oceanica]